MKKKAYAKVNLGLKVIGKRNDGYHNLEMVMARVSLYDTLIFKKFDTISVECPGVREEDNLIYKIAKYLKENYSVNTGVKITVIKRIPVMAGLGGGSSDGAEAIKGLNEFWGLSMSQEEMVKVSLLFGSDIPFFLSKGPSFVSGRGEEVSKINIKKPLNLLLIKPEVGFKTKEIFSSIEKHSNKGELNKLIDSLNNGEDLNGISNDLESALDDNKKGIVNSIKGDLVAYGAKYTLMSGAGSCVFGVFDSLKKAKKAYKELSLFYEVYLVKTIGWFKNVYLL